MYMATNKRRYSRPLNPPNVFEHGSYLHCGSYCGRIMMSTHYNVSQVPRSGGTIRLGMLYGSTYIPTCMYM